MLSGTADALERNILAQVRVIYPGLEIPLRLPGRDSVLVRVVKLTPQPHHALPQEPPYALLVADSEIEIESPPVRPGSVDVGAHRKAHKRVSAFYRVVPYRKAAVPSLLENVALTHAVLHADSAEDDVSSHGLRFALASRKGHGSDKQLALPIAFLSHPDVPKGHVSLPPWLWKDLELSPFVPVLFDEMPPFEKGGKEIGVTKLPASNPTISLSLTQFIQGSGVYYDGMCLRDVRIRLNDTETSNEKGACMKKDVDIWDREGIKEIHDEPGAASDNLFAALHDNNPTEFLENAKKKRLVKEGRQSFPTQTVCEPSNAREPLESSSHTVWSAPGPGPQKLANLFKEPKQPQLLSPSDTLSSLTASERNAVESIIRLSSSCFKDRLAKKQKQNICRAVSLEGPLGSGKTYVCRAVASLLTDLALVRTVWIRGKVHSGERQEVSINRIQRAFAAAIDGGPGLIVLDDLDMLLGSRASDRDRETNDSDGKSGRRGQAIARELEHHIKKLHSEPVFLIMTCESANDLDSSLRSPGILRNVVHLPLPTATERMLLFWTGLQCAFCLPATSSVLSSMKRDGDSLRALSEGYGPKDIIVSLKRTRIALELARVTGEEADNTQILRFLTTVLTSMTPSSRSGISFSKEKEGESLAWSKLGALESAKSALWESLQLPSSRPDIFIKAPIRLPHGILLYGPPGCGKTMLARIAAVESRMRCVMVKGPELLSKYIGESEAEVRRAFEKAANSTPCILLFDEFDSLAPRRGGEHTGVADRVVNTLLTCMDGAERLSEGVYIIATTSRPELIDPALLRPGRLDRWIPVDIPSSVEERLDILRSLSTGFFPSAPHVDTALRQVAEDTDGYTGADLGAVLNDAHLQQGKRERISKEIETSLSIPELLRDAHQRSRPSLSRSQREYFARSMLQFAPQESKHQNGTIGANTQRTAQLFGKRVALQ